jgi:hypothetical protein
MDRRPFWSEIAEVIEAHRPWFTPSCVLWLRLLLPTIGNMVFTMLVVGSLFWVSRIGTLSLASSAAISTSTIPYQGWLASSTGTPLTGNYSMIFCL